MEWQPCEPPGFKPTDGSFVRLERWDRERDEVLLFEAIGGPGNDDLWDYIPFGVPASAEVLSGVLSYGAESQGWQTLIFRAPDSEEVLGMASYMRIRPEMGSAEVGAVVFSKRLQKTPAATEGIFLMARHLFEDLGYRRFEWKCDDGNAGSRRAALRFGFVEEGIFRQDMIVRGRNRDTAWFSMLDGEWPRIREGFLGWLAAENFEASGQQLRSLQEVRQAAG